MFHNDKYRSIDAVTHHREFDFLSKQSALLDISKNILTILVHCFQLEDLYRQISSTASLWIGLSYISIWELLIFFIQFVALWWDKPIPELPDDGRTDVNNIHKKRYTI